MLKMNLICEAALKETREPCIILKVKGTYNTQTNGSTPGKLICVFFKQLLEISCFNLTQTGPVILLYLNV